MNQQEIDLVRKEICDLEISFVSLFNECFSEIESLAPNVKDTILKTLLIMNERYLKLVYEHSICTFYGNEFLYGIEGFYHAIEKSNGVENLKEFVVKPENMMKTKNIISFEEDNTEGKLIHIFETMKQLKHIELVPIDILPIQ